MKLLWTQQGWEDYRHWIATDRKILRKVDSLIKDIQRSPFSGIARPEALKHELSGWWSREIGEEHRLVYRVVDQIIEIAQSRGHY
jgi:toxin YoeB